MYLITRSYHFSAAHMLVGHDKCGRMHGHNYRLDVTVGTGKLDPAKKRYWVMDFGDLDKIVKKIIKPFDHRFIETEAGELAQDSKWVLAQPDSREDVYYVSIPESTAEALAEWFAWKIDSSMIKKGTQLQVKEVTVWETVNGRATWTPQTG